jgi:hypothetical protein
MVMMSVMFTVAIDFIAFNVGIYAACRLAAVVSGVLGNQVPVTMTALEAMARLLAVLEEVNHDTRLVVYEPVMLKLTSACAAVRHQVRLKSSELIPSVQTLEYNL